jgi:hypothetical protein
MPRGRKCLNGSMGGQRVKCIITGRVTLLNTNILKKKLEEYGTVESVQEHYICREAAKYLRRGIGPIEIRKLLGIKDKGWKEYDQSFLETIISKGGKIKKNSNGETITNTAIENKPVKRTDSGGRFLFKVKCNSGRCYFVRTYKSEFAINWAVEVCHEEVKDCTEQVNESGIVTIFEL